MFAPRPLSLHRRPSPRYSQLTSVRPSFAQREKPLAPGLTWTIAGRCLEIRPTYNYEAVSKGPESAG